MQGWIKLHRKFISWEWYKDANVMRLFVHCLLKANHQDKQWQGHMIKRGSFITSLDTLSHELGLSVKQIRTAISKLERTSEVAKKGQSKFTVIQVVNYEEYQEEGKQKGSEKANKGQTKGKQRATTKNEENEKNEKEITYTAEADEIYSLYPSKCPTKNSSTGKTKRNKEKIQKILKSKEETVDSLKAKITRYVRESKAAQVYLKNFGTFLNNLPDYSEEEKKEELKKDSPYDFWKDQLLNDPNTIFDGTFFYMEHTRNNTLDYSQYMELARLNDDKRKRQSHAR